MCLPQRLDGRGSPCENSLRAKSECLFQFYFQRRCPMTREARRFSIRDVIFITTIVALAIAWWLERRESRDWHAKYDRLKLYNHVLERLDEAFPSKTFIYDNSESRGSGSALNGAMPRGTEKTSPPILLALSLIAFPS